MGYHVDNVILSFHYYLLTTMSNNETIALELLENLGSNITTTGVCRKFKFSTTHYSVNSKSILSR